MTIFQLAIVLGIMVLVHEFGHFAVAKLCGVRVEVFSLGFGKRILGFRRGDTDYRISALPLGGYVKMAGDNPGEAPTGDSGEFNAHPRWQRVLVAVAGPIANFILAFVLILGLNMTHHQIEESLTQPTVVDYVPAKSLFVKSGLQIGDTIVHYNTVENPHFDDIFNQTQLNLDRGIRFSYLHNGHRTDTTVTLAGIPTPDKMDELTFDQLLFVPQKQDTPVQVALVDHAVSEGSPAQRAGLLPGDTIVSIDKLTPHSVDALLTYLQDQAGKPANLTIDRNHQILHATLTPEQTDSGDGIKLYRIGIVPVQPPVKIGRLSLVPAAIDSAKTNWKSASLIKDVIKGLFLHRVSMKQMSGPIGIGQQVHQAFQMPGWNPIIDTMAAISLNLGMLNLLPFPILDGGMILFLLIESAIRRDVNQHIKERVYQVAFMCIIVFFVFIMFNDLSKLPLFAKLKL